MVVTLYYMDLSPPCRSIMLLAKSIGLDLNLKPTDLFTGEHLKPEFLKMNPQHTIPTMDDDGFYLHESRAILAYLAHKYAADNDNLHPKCPKKRAVVDEMLLFDMGTLYQRFSEAYYPVLFKGQKDYIEEKMQRLDEVLGWLNDILGKTGYVAGDSMSIADFTVVASVSTMQLVALEHDLSKYGNITKYMEKCKKEMKDYQQANQKGADEFGDYAKKTLKKE